MDLETWAFFLFGMGFFCFVIRWIVREQREDRAERVMEAREFGFGGKGQHNTKTLRGK